MLQARSASSILLMGVPARQREISARRSGGPDPIKHTPDLDLVPGLAAVGCVAFGVEVGGDAGERPADIIGRSLEMVNQSDYKFIRSL